MNKIILLIIFLANDLYGYSQLTSRRARDTSGYVILKDSTTIYSKKVWERSSLKDGDYLLLDNNRKVPISEVARYKSRYMEYIRQKGPVETYRVEKEGPRLFVYSRAYYYSDSSGFKEGRDYFFRKGSMDELKEMSYKNLKDAMADNAASMRQLQASRTTLLVAGSMGAVGFLSFMIGAAQSFKKNSNRVNSNQPGQPGPPTFPRPGQPIPPTQTIHPGKTSVSPLLIVGPVIMIGGMITLFTAPGHIHKAIDIYNQ